MIRFLIPQPPNDWALLDEAEIPNG